MERTIKMQIDVPESFSFEIERKLLELKQSGVKKTKAQYIIELAQIGYKWEKIDKK